MKKWYFLLALAVGLLTACEKDKSNIAGTYYSSSDDTYAELKLLSNHTFNYESDQYIPRTGNELETYGTGKWSYSNGIIKCEGVYYRINHKNPDSDWAKNDIYEWEYHTTYVVRGGLTLTKK